MDTRVPTIYVLSKNKKNIFFFLLEIFIFIAIKSLYIAWACFRNENLDSNQTVLKSVVSIYMLRYHKARITKNSDC